MCVFYHLYVSWQELKQDGFSALALRRSGVSCDELKRLGYGPRELRAAHVEAAQLRRLFAVEDLRQAGFKAKELSVGGKRLREAGYGWAELRVLGLQELRAVASARDMRRSL